MPNSTNNQTKPILYYIIPTIHISTDPSQRSAFHFIPFRFLLCLCVYMWGGPLWIFHGLSQAQCVLILWHIELLLIAYFRAINNIEWSERRPKLIRDPFILSVSVTFTSIFLIRCVQFIWESGVRADTSLYCTILSTLLFFSLSLSSFIYLFVSVRVSVCLFVFFFLCSIPFHFTLFFNQYTLNQLFKFALQHKTTHVCAYTQHAMPCRFSLLKFAREKNYEETT